MAKKELASTVHVADDDGVDHAFGPGDEVPAWATKQITNPKAWATDDGADEKPKRGSAGAVKRPTTE